MGAIYFVWQTSRSCRTQYLIPNTQYPIPNTRAIPRPLYLQGYPSCAGIRASLAQGYPPAIGSWLSANQTTRLRKSNKLHQWNVWLALMNPARRRLTKGTTISQPEEKRTSSSQQVKLSIFNLMGEHLYIYILSARDESLEIPSTYDSALSYPTGYHHMMILPFILIFFHAIVNNSSTSQNNLVFNDAMYPSHHCTNTHIIHLKHIHGFIKALTRTI